MTFDTNGIILKPLQPNFAAYASSSQTISDYSGHDIVFGGEDYDIGSNFASNTFTAPVAGKYQFNVQVQVNSVADWLKIKLIPSGKQYQWYHNPNHTSTMCSFSQIVSLAANDTVKVTIVANDNDYTIEGGSGSTYHQTTFSGFLVG